MTSTNKSDGGEVERFDCELSADSHGYQHSEMVENPVGSWVRYADYERALAENERLRAEVSHERWLRNRAEDRCVAVENQREVWREKSERLSQALRLLPDDIDMIEHHPYDGARYFCCDKSVAFHVHPSRWPPGSEHINGRSHAPDCWYTEMKKIMNEGD